MRNKNVLYSVLAVVLLALVALIYFAPADFEGKVLQQADIQQGLANGHETQEYEAQTGRKALWTGSLFSGMPTFQISPSYPANKMMEWVAKLYTLWLPSPANLLFAMMLGFFIMCLCLKMKWPVALFGAVAWGFSTYFIIILGAGHIWKFLTLSYIPPMIGGIALCYRGRYLGGAALTALFAALQLGSNHPQMTYYFLYVVAALAIAWLCTALRERRFGRWAAATSCVIGAGGLGVCANMASIYMSYEYSKETIRGRATDLVAEGQVQAPGGLSYDYITQWSYGIDETWTLLIPNVKGGASLKPRGGDMEPKTILNSDGMKNAYLTPVEQQFAYYFMEYFGNQPMTNGPVYVGAFVLVLAILAMFVVEGRRAGPVKWALFCVSILAILLSWGHNFQPFTEFFIDNVPMYNKFRTPSSMLVVVEFCVPLLAAMCVVTMVKRHDEFLRRYGTTFFTVAGIAALVCLAGWIAPGIFGDPWSASEHEWIVQNNLLNDPRSANVLRMIEDSRLSLVSTDCLRSLIFIVLGFLVCWLYLRGAYRNSVMFGCALTAVVLIDLFSVNKRYVDYDNFTEPLPQAATFEPTEADRTILADTTPNYRVLDVDEFSKARSSYFHKTLGGYHAAKLTRYNDLIDNQILKGNEEVINMLNARWLISKGKAVFNPDAFGNAWFVDRVVFVDTPNAEMAALDSLPLRRMAVADKQYRGILGSSAPAARGDTIFETFYAPGLLEYQAETHAGGVAVFSEVFFPWGWEATVDGKPVDIGRVNYTLRALNIPPGKHHIRFEFKPKRLQATNTLGVVSVSLIYLLCLAAIVGLFLKRRRHDGGSDKADKIEKIDKSDKSYKE
ncbi:MAG: YfhO family protein [Muribaculaceae bacterium]|nr:YfhO family protein [Muribaculaceae bacterium]